MSKRKHRTADDVRVVYSSEDGVPVVYVTTTKGKTFCLDAMDWERVRNLYGPLWRIVGDGKGRRYVRGHGLCYVPGGWREYRRNVTLQRAVMDAKPWQRVRFVNGNPLDCRRVNLYFARRPPLLKHGYR